MAMVNTIVFWQANIFLQCVNQMSVSAMVFDQRTSAAFNVENMFLLFTKQAILMRT
jgi:hypothetical protein